jgi:hypothetical protein
MKTIITLFFLYHVVVFSQATPIRKVDEKGKPGKCFFIEGTYVLQLKRNFSFTTTRQATFGGEFLDL